MGAIELFMSDGARGCQAVILNIDAIETSLRRVDAQKHNKSDKPNN